ncbi:MAG: protein kinase [Cycloclasticus sp. symbiont of Bathymodiolus heckerae]|nr:MAG: protein kinase [Cycloclasticus sp. symbiont of Bathymodiolus heckerae]
MTKNSLSPTTSIPANNLQALPSGTVVDDYIIERVLAQGGFSTVYLARQTKDQQQVAIKEYKPDHLTKRDGAQVTPIDPDAAALFQRGRHLFMKEATLLTTIKHPNIVSVINFFLCNNTAYLVMNFDYGITLGNWLKDTENTITSEFLLDVFQPVMRCIKNMHHRGLLHLDIKPDNILLRPSYNPLILDFGSTLSYTDKQNLSSHSMTKGFAAPEQYDKSHALGPWSDCYTIGASMLACLDRATPPASNDQAAIENKASAHLLYKNNIDEKILYAIDWAMQLSPAKRPQTIDDLLNAINYR